jgi:hypothetical protein
MRFLRKNSVNNGPPPLVNNLLHDISLLLYVFYIELFNVKVNANSGKSIKRRHEIIIYAGDPPILPKAIVRSGFAGKLPAGKVWGILKKPHLK